MGPKMLLHCSATERRLHEAWGYSMDDGLQLNLTFEGSGTPNSNQTDWRCRKREAREVQLKKRQRYRNSNAARAPGAPAAAQAPHYSAAAAVQNGADDSDPVATDKSNATKMPTLRSNSQNRPPARHRGSQRYAKDGQRQKRPANDSLHGYGAIVQGQQLQRKKTKMAEPAPATEQPAKAQEAGGDPPQQRSKLTPLAAVVAGATAAADSFTAADSANIMALVALNMNVEQQIQQDTTAAAAAGSKTYKQQGKVLSGVVEFGDIPDEPDHNALAQQAAKRHVKQQKQHGSTAGSKEQRSSTAEGPGSQQQQKQKQKLAQHKVGEMAHAEPNVPAEQRKQLFGESSTAAAAAAGSSDSHSWPGLGLSEVLSAHLIQLNFQEPTAVQQQAVPVLLSGRDAAVRSPTGSGKTLAYLAPIVHCLQSCKPRINRHDGTHALVLVPTRELAVQVSDVLTAIVRRFCWLVPGMLIGGEHRGHEKARLRKGVTVLVATPGRLLDHLQNTSSFKTHKLRWLVLDEADRLLDLGFEQKLKQIVEALDARLASAAGNSYSTDEQPQRQTVLLSATLHPGLTTLAGLSMQNPVGVGFNMDVVDGRLQLTQHEQQEQQHQQQQTVKQQGVAAAAAGQFEVPHQLQQKYVEVPAKMRLVALVGALCSRLRRSRLAKLVVFFSNCDSVDFHHQLLLQQSAAVGNHADVDAAMSEPLLGGTPVLRLHGDMKQPERTSSLVTFAKAKSCVLLCTDVAARGLDFPAVSTIIQYDPAGDPAEYVHRVGRTARMGQQGESLIFLLPSEMPYVHLLQQSGVQLTGELAGSLLQCLPGLAGPGGPATAVLQFARKIQRGSSIDGNKGQQKGSKSSGGSTVAVESTAAKTGVGVSNEGLTGAKPEQLAAALLLQRQLIHTVSADQELSRLALIAFRSFICAYTTYPSFLKHVFHVKSLHLGHLAASFGLREAPKKIGAGGAATERKKRKLQGQMAAVKKQKKAWHKSAQAAAAMGL